MNKLHMKANFNFFLLILTATAFQACSSTGTPKRITLASDGTIISARGALGRLESVPSGPLYTGDGGGNIRLAILAPQVQGDVPGYLPIYIQGLLNNNFNRYSAINLIDRQNLDRIIAEQNLAANGRFSDNDFVRIGNLTNAQYFLFGTIQRLSGDRYSLQLSVTDSSTGIRRADFMRDGTLTQLEGRGTLLNEAAAEMLAQLGVQLTETGLQTLLAGNTSTVLAEAGLARGITAQAGGSEIEALFNYTQAITFDPSQIEALSRLNILSSTISGGTISQRIVNDIQARDRWLEALKETARFFNDHPPFEIIFDPNLIQIGQTDYARRTANIGMRIALDSSQAGFDALNALLEGLEKTGRRRDWGFSGWPLMDITPRTAGTVVFGGRRSLSFKVDVALINENNKTIGNSSITLTTETIGFSAGDTMVTIPDSVYETVSFSNVKTEDLTPTLTIMIVAVNGISSHNLSASGYMKIETGDLEQEELEAAQISTPNRERSSTVLFADDAKFWSIGISAGTSFAAPFAIGTIRGTIAPFKYSFLELGFDYGLISGIADAESYYSLYPFVHYNLFLPFTQSINRQDIISGWYAGAGGGFMLAEYTFPEGKIPVNTFALDLITGMNLWNMLDISYTLRTDFKSANNKISVGYTYRFR
jgi:tetratricopeptide (TPR) repeat protein